MLFYTKDYTVVFLSYDEPNSKENYEQLLSIKPGAFNVHGVKGSDAAHKAAASLATTSHVIIIDGDNFVKPDFFTKTYVLDNKVDLNNSVLSFSSYNPLNGCNYGNGGIKIWPVSLINSMQTHENSTETSIDFDLTKYLQLNDVGSDVLITASPLQAWRAGFREGIKLSLENNQVTSKINWRNYDRLYRWTHVGADITNGAWAILGARMGVHMVGTFDLNKLNDFDYLNEFFEEIQAEYKDNLIHECNKIGNLVNMTPVFGPYDSNEYRHIPSILRSEENFIKHKYHPPYDIVFVAENEPNAQKNFLLLQERFPNCKRAETIHEASFVATTDYFWVVDVDSIIVDEFEFIYNIDFYEEPVSRVFLAKDKDGNISDKGAVKLLNRMSTFRKEHTETQQVIILTNYTEKQ